MPSVTRISDSTVGICDKSIPDCCPHGRSGTNGTGRQDVEVNDNLIHCLTDTGPCNCPHGGTFESSQGCGDVDANELPVTLVGHETVCMSCGKSGSHVTGSPDVIVGEGFADVEGTVIPAALR